MILIFKHTDFVGRHSGGNVRPKHRWGLKLKKGLDSVLAVISQQGQLNPRAEGTVQRAEFREWEEVPAKEKERSALYSPIYLHNHLLSEEKYSTMIPTVVNRHPEVNDLIRCQ